MIIGILSDTHGRVAPTAAALEALRGAGVEFYIHCGDVGDQPVFDLLAGLPLAFVWGNTDYDRAELSRYAETLGLKCHDEYADLELGGKRIAVTHGDNPAILRQIIDGARHDYLFYGHTHVARDETIKGLRYVNPGALHRVSRPSVAVLDTVRNEVKFLAINTPRK